MSPGPWGGRSAQPSPGNLYPLLSGPPGGLVGCVALNRRAHRAVGVVLTVHTSRMPCPFPAVRAAQSAWHLLAAAERTEGNMQSRCFLGWLGSRRSDPGSRAGHVLSALLQARDRSVHGANGRRAAAVPRCSCQDLQGAGARGMRRCVSAAAPGVRPAVPRWWPRRVDWNGRSLDGRVREHHRLDLPPAAVYHRGELVLLARNRSVLRRRRDSPREWRRRKLHRAQCRRDGLYRPDLVL